MKPAESCPSTRGVVSLLDKAEELAVTGGALARVRCLPAARVHMCGSQAAPNSTASGAGKALLASEPRPHAISRLWRAAPQEPQTLPW